MALPPDLRVLCHLLSSTPTTQLPRKLPNLLRHVSQCQGPLSAADTSGKGDTSENSVLIHRLKTQTSTLLYGKSPEGRFVAAALVKSLVETGGWEVLRGVEYWARGLLAILGKPDTVAAKRLCILALTKIYLMTHQYPSLVREITTPTLPNFVSSCLNLISPKSFRRVAAPLSLIETVFDALSALIRSHPAIFRPSTNQIRVATRPYLAPTLCDRLFVPMSLSRSARRLTILLYHTAAKNTGGEEWGKGIRELIGEIHGTVDLVYRAVIEDWESAAGYVSQSIDMNQELNGAGKSETDLPHWTGVDAGLERLVGLIGLLEEHFVHGTPTAVTIPLGIIIDLQTRLLSVVPPTLPKESSDIIRLNSSIERNEREGLYCGLPGVHVAAMKTYIALARLLGCNFMAIAHGTLDQAIWVFPTGKHAETFRTVTYRLVSRLLPLIGTSLSRKTVAAMRLILNGCIEDCQLGADKTKEEKHTRGMKYSNFDHFLFKDETQPTIQRSQGPAIMIAASELLPLLLSHLPQQHLREQHRAELDRVAILGGYRRAMVASVLNPFTKRNGDRFYSVLPHLARAFPGDEAVELLLRPRAKPIDQAKNACHGDPENAELQTDDLMEDIPPDVSYNVEAEPVLNTSSSSLINTDAKIEEHQKPVNLWDQSSLDSNLKPDVTDISKWTNSLGEATPQSAVPAVSPEKTEFGLGHTSVMPQDEEEDDSEGSVHLIMDLSDSDDSKD